MLKGETLNAVKFQVTDIRTGEYPDLSSIALGVEDWAWGLNPLCIDGFYMSEDGKLMIRDKLGNYAYCPHGRFVIKFVFESNKTVISFVY